MLKWEGKKNAGDGVMNGNEMEVWFFYYSFLLSHLFLLLSFFPFLYPLSPTPHPPTPQINIKGFNTISVTADSQYPPAFVLYFAGLVGSGFASKAASSIHKKLSMLNKVKGKIQIVDSFGDFKVQIDDTWPDLKVKKVFFLNFSFYRN